jgi:hypothetical protein
MADLRFLPIEVDKLFFSGANGFIRATFCEASEKQTKLRKYDCESLSERLHLDGNQNGNFNFFEGKNMVSLLFDSFARFQVFFESSASSGEGLFLKTHNTNRHKFTEASLNVGCNIELRYFFVLRKIGDPRVFSF